MGNNNGTFRIRNLTQARTDFTIQADGSVNISGSLTTGSSTVYPDFVFEPDYPLMPLADLRVYIAREGHLPDVPSREEVEAAGGVNVTELQLDLLRKVEELTLYVLSLEAKVRDLVTEGER